MINPNAIKVWKDRKYRI